MNSLFRRRRSIIAQQEEPVGPYTIYGDSLIWEQGYLPTDTLDTSYTTWISSGYVKVNGNEYIDYTGPTEDENLVPWLVRIRQFDANKTYIGGSNILTAAGVYTQRKLVDGCKYIRICFGHESTTEVITSVDSGDLVVMPVTPGATWRIPNDYYEVEYVRGASQAYLNTGIVPVVNPRVVTSVKVGNTEAKRRGIFGSSESTVPYFYILNYYTSANNVNTRYGSLDSAVKGVAVLRQNTEWVSLDCSNVFNVNGTAIRTCTAVSFANNTAPIVLNKQSQSSAANYGIYYFKETKVYDGTELKADLVPCYRRSDNKVGMYDLVRETFIVGSGTWTKGEIVT